MFCTLKYNEADERSSLERTAPPFLKAKRSLSKIACTNCRSSKLKCTGESDGCRRCAVRQLSCRYSTPIQPSSAAARKTAEKRKDLTQRVRHAADTVESEHPKQEYDFQYTTVSLAELDSLSSMDSWESLGSLHTAHGNTMGLDGQPPSIEDMISGEPFLSVASRDPFHVTDWSIVGSQGGSISPYRCVDTNVPTPVEHRRQPAPPVANNKHTHSCFIRAAQTYETIEVSLVWGLKESHSEAVGDVFEQLKLALAACECLLQCQQCTMQHEYVMLLISMSRKIVGALESLYHMFWLAAPRRGSRVTFYTRQHSLSRGKTRLPSLRPSWTPSSGSETDLLMEGSSGDSSTSSPLDGSNCGHGSERLGLDADDEHVVFQSLLLARAARLDVFIDRLEKLVTEERWPVHREGTRELQERVKALLSY
ncbi:hypothetical protein BO78DRAFT_414303 [Aspergillus sclerotiicarbonarius CBS 121057]|uniref:Zn(2)-C6 fungal-type domain-containing protein n=1 Tax=Aspergillus sclerotiicarbonarius (strain CBS 121057 / IBT 28362) TaxID=1448318 RepID=A0A319ES73_ASPSB|nr:hypothetical protein BO78DRAFT_414303 [Aspergillus sclerotiicarbonarius CBS 121057]